MTKIKKDTEVIEGVMKTPIIFRMDNIKWIGRFNLSKTFKRKL